MMRQALLIFCLLLLVTAAAAQPNEAKKTTASAEVPKIKPEKDPEAERIIRERRANAQSLLISLASDATSYNDLRLRARTLAQIADVLWEADKDRARVMFRKAWDAAEVVDEENRRITLDELKRQQTQRSNVAVITPANIRGEILRLAARRDRKLGEELLAKLTVEKQQEATETADKNRNNFSDTPEAITQRLNLARQLLDSDVERAIQFADPALIGINRDVVDFLCYLREKDAAAADRRYAALLARAAGDVKSDANTVSLLSSYLFTPHVFVSFDGGGGANTQSSGRIGPPPEVATDLSGAFFRMASEILLRPLAPPGEDQTSAGIVGKYLMLKRLMPLFDQFAPKETAEALHAQMEALSNGVSEETRARDDGSVREGIRPQETSENREKALLDRIDHAKTSEERDRLYVQLARLISESGDVARTRDYIDKIEDSEIRKLVRAYTDTTMILHAVEKKDADRILELVRTGELPHVQKTWALAQAAKLLSKTDSERALSLLDQADAEARRIEPSDPDRPRALMAIANTFLLIDRKKAWDAVYDAAKAANAATDFTGEDGVLRAILITKGSSSIRSSSAREFDLAPILAELANEDYNRTVELARLFEREAPRATATIAIARAVLEEKKK